MEYPPCRTSENEDGSYNFSYPRSCFYTVNDQGDLRCKELPDEELNLRSIEMNMTVCGVILDDMTGKDKTDEVWASVEKVFHDYIDSIMKSDQ